MNTVTRHNPERAIQIADRTYWVGRYLENDSFQCHVYLLENGDQSVLVDPGSVITFPETRRKVEEILPFEKIRYFICHHQDPDLTSALTEIDRTNRREDAVVVTHWRARALLKHYGWKLPFWQIEDHDWTLELPDRTLRFVFTPYLHFPGAFCTFDQKTRVLFSSDLFGGFTEGFQLFAEDEGYFEALRPFHEHYMPSRELLQHGLLALQEHPIRMIAPQHGSIIPEPLVQFMIERLKTLECGLFTAARTGVDVHRLSRLNHILRDLTKAMILHRDLREIVERLLQVVRRLVPQTTSVELVARAESGEVLTFTPQSRYRPVLDGAESTFAPYLRLDGDRFRTEYGADYRLTPLPTGDTGLILPLFGAEGRTIRGLAVLHLAGRIDESPELEELAHQIAQPLWVVVEREIILRQLEGERRRYYQQSIRDPLTGLFTRYYMEDAATRLVQLHERNRSAEVSVVALDLDHFKRINDEHGHAAGDEVLRRVGELLRRDTRPSDLAVRIGGEEFLVFLPGTRLEDCARLGERLRAGVAGLCFEGPLAHRHITVSLGIAAHRLGEPLPRLLERVDHALYEAKRTGRDRICSAD